MNCEEDPANLDLKKKKCLGVYTLSLKIIIILFIILIRGFFIIN